jgi:hypothetical protein
LRIRIERDAEQRLKYVKKVKGTSMNLCRKCGWSLLPFAMVALVSGVSAFLTWLTLTYSQFEETQVVAGSAIVFFAVAATVLHYVQSCMKRHCHHSGEERRGAAP